MTRYSNLLFQGRGYTKDKNAYFNFVKSICVIVNHTTKNGWNKQVIQKNSTKISDDVGIGTQELTERKTWVESFRKGFERTHNSSSKCLKWGSLFKPINFF